jgi:hypothetical protein
MPTHKFKIGQLVYLRPSAARNVPGGQYVITKRLPEHDGEFEYQEPHERIARESELMKAT